MKRDTEKRVREREIRWWKKIIFSQSLGVVLAVITNIMLYTSEETKIYETTNPKV